jgi:hypothetical protein
MSSRFRGSWNHGKHNHMDQRLQLNQYLRFTKVRVMDDKKKESMPNRRRLKNNHIQNGSSMN